jgi:MerR family transcriptional regulator, light-induced transcriptional regulator
MVSKTKATQGERSEGVCATAAAWEDGMALNQKPDHWYSERDKPNGSARPVPFLVGLWRQIGAELQPRRSLADEPELFEALESEIIPRLVIANHLPNAYPMLVRSDSAGPQLAFSPRDRNTFMDALLADDANLVSAVANAHLANGRDASTILMELFAWAARELGDLWSDDRVSFVDVTVGLCRLHEALHRFSEQAGAPFLSEDPEAPSILIASAPGEQHVFGVLMAGEFFRQKGWSVTTDTSGDAGSVTRLLAARQFDIAGVSASHDGAVPGLTDLLQAMRKASRNRDVKILVGGFIFEQNPHLAHQLGADGMAGRGLDAPDLARNMLAMS